MKQGIKSIEELYQNLEEQRENRKDIIADTRSLVVNSSDGITTLSVSTGDDILSYSVSDVSHRQIAERLSIPFKYYERMRADYPELLDKNVNGWLQKNPEKRMLRTLDGKLRACMPCMVLQCIQSRKVMVKGTSSQKKDLRMISPVGSLTFMARSLTFLTIRWETIR